MANKLDFEKELPGWKAEGIEPPEERKKEGFKAGYKPPAGFFNWFWRVVSDALSEIREKTVKYCKENEEDKKAHKQGEVLDHPDGSVTDQKLGERSIGNTQGLLGVLLNKIGDAIKALKGTAKWDDPPAVTLDKAMSQEVYDPTGQRRDVFRAASTSMPGITKLNDSYSSSSSSEAATPNAVYKLKQYVDIAITEALKNQHPVGHVYITQSKTDNPNNRFSGTWTLTGVNRTIRGASSSENAGTTGGADIVSLSAANLPNHTHGVPGQAVATSYVDLNHAHGVSAWLNDPGGHEHYYSNASGGPNRAQVYNGSIIGANSPPAASTWGGGGHWHGGVSAAAGTSAGAGYNLNHAHSLSVDAVNTNSTIGAYASSFSTKNQFELMYIWKRTS